MVNCIRGVHLTKEAIMVSIHKDVGVMACAFLLSLGLSNMVQAEHSPSASDVMKTDSHSGSGPGFQSDDDRQRNADDKKGSTRVEDARMITGELFRIKNANYFVKLNNGEEVRLHTDKTTQMIGTIKKNHRIEAMVNNENHALSIRSTK